MPNALVVVKTSARVAALGGMTTADQSVVTPVDIHSQTLMSLNKMDDLLNEASEGMGEGSSKKDDNSGDEKTNEKPKAKKKTNGDKPKDEGEEMKDKDEHDGQDTQSHDEHGRDGECDFQDGCDRPHCNGRYDNCNGHRCGNCGGRRSHGCGSHGGGRGHCH